MSEAVIRGLMEIWRQFAQMSDERRVGEAGEAGEARDAREGERVADGVDGMTMEKVRKWI
jgi:hypothetical protein